jgi:hypothetical protein
MATKSSWIWMRPGRCKPWIPYIWKYWRQF